MTTPYSDSQVFAKLDTLEEACKRLAAHCYPTGKWYVSGSISKGRFGAHSDVDLTCDAAFRPGQIEALNRQGGWGAGPFKESFQSGSPDLIYGSVHSDQDVSAVLVGGELLRRKLSKYYAVVPLEVRTVEHDHGFLADIYVRSLTQKGYQVERQGDSIDVKPPDLSPQRAPEKSWTRP